MFMFDLLNAKKSLKFKMFVKNTFPLTISFIVISSYVSSSLGSEGPKMEIVK